MRGWQRRWLGATVSLALVGGVLGTAGTPARAEPVTGVTAAVTAARPAAALESRGVASKVSSKVTKTDKVKAPKIKWYACGGRLRCATVKLPRDYDHPRGAKVEVAIVKLKARKSKQRIGSLFVNPGGPGGQGTSLAAAAEYVFSPKIIDRFDIIGMDPRGIGFSGNVKCFSSALKQIGAYKGLSVPFPVTARERKAWITSTKKIGAACKRNRLATSMSTAQVARDMEMIRRALKEPKLNYVGFSYGSYLGQVYANMYPSRFRTVAIDGVLDGRSWAGTGVRRKKPLEARLASGAGAWRALRTILQLCDQAGASTCDFAPNAYGRFNRLVAKLKAEPLAVTDDDGEVLFRYTYAGLIADLQSALYDPAGWSYAIDILTETYQLAIDPSFGPSDDSSDDRRAAAATRLGKLRSEVAKLSPTHGFPYDNGFEAFASVTCTDSRETVKTRSYYSWQKRVAPHFGALWLWTTSICASDAFKGNDEDAYRGPFDRRTKASVLVVGNDYDPATNVAGAQTAAREMPNARFLRSRTFGHTAYGVSSCVTNAVDQYLLTGKARRSYAVCADPAAPFTTDPDETEKAHARARLLAKLQGRG